MEKNQSEDLVNAFLSCSVRPKDWPLVDSIVNKVLKPMGFRCFTIGRNVSLADQTDEAISQLLDSCECLVGVATERLEAVDRDFPDQTLRVATPYLLQETSMAFQSRLPYLMFKAEGITLLGVTNRNLWLEIEGQLHNGRVRFKGTPALVHSALRDLKRKALERRAKLGWEKTNRNVERLAKYLVGGYGIYLAFDWLGRPDCFGNFYYKDPVCKECSYKDKCKIKKAELRKG